MALYEEVTVKGTEKFIEALQDFKVNQFIFSFVRGSVKKRYGGGWRSLLEKDPDHLRQE